MAKLSKNFKNISQEKLKKSAAEMLGHLKNPEKGVGTELFDAIIKVVPQTAVDIIVVDNLKNPKKVLLTARSDQYYKGWHFPGGFIRFSETAVDAVENVILRELGVKVKKLEDTRERYELLDERGHTIAFIFLVELSKSSKNGKWFDSIPKDLLWHQKEVLKAILGWK